MRRIALSVTALVSLISLTACEGPGQNCDLMAVSSVGLTLVDINTGEGIVGADVQYQVDGGELKDCESWSEDNEYTCGVEEDGEFLILVDAEGYTSIEIETLVEADVCHVIPVSLEEGLVPIADAL